MLASYHGHAPLVSLLLKHNADPNRLNDRGQSPLAGVVFKNEAEVIKLLLEGGADPEIGTPSALDSTKVRVLLRGVGLTVCHDLHQHGSRVSSVFRCTWIP